MINFVLPNPEGCQESQLDFHDGKLRGIHLLGEGVAELDLCSYEYARYSLRLEGVAKLRMTEFKEGNTINSLVVRPATLISREMIADLLGPDPISVHVSSVYNTCVEKSLFFVELQPSYGCTLVATCSHVALISVEGCGVGA